MTETVLAALVSAAAAVAGSALAAISSSRLTAYKIEELRSDFRDLTERVNRHNQVVERLAIAEESLKSAHRRIDTLTGGDRS